MSQTAATKERLDQYHLELKYSSEWRRTYEPVWEECADLYRHRHRYSTVKSGEQLDKIMVGLSFSLIRTMLAATAVSSPYITVEETKPHHNTAAMVGEEAINQIWYRERFRRPTRDAWLDALVIGHGWAKTGWKFGIDEFDRNPAALDADFQEVARMVDMLAQNGQMDPSQLPSDDEIRATLEKRGFRVLVDTPTFDRVSPWDIFVDPHAVRPEKLRWISQRIRMPLEHAKEQTHWDTKARKALTALDSDGLGFYGERADRERFRESAVEWVDVWEYWDIEAGTVSTFGGSGGERFLIEPQAQPFKHGHPFVMVRANDVSDEFYPIGELEVVKDQQYEINRIRSTQLDALKNQRRQYLIPQALAQNQAFRSAVEANEPDTLIPIPQELWDGFVDDKTPPMMAVPQGGVPADLYAMSGTVTDDFLTIAGASDYFLGGAPASRTATEAAVANSGQQSRDQFKLDTLEEFVADVARNVFQNMQCFMQTRDFARITGKQTELGVDKGGFIAYDRTAIAGDFDFKVEAGSTQPLNPAERTERAMQMMTAIAPILPAIPTFNFEALARYFLEAAGVKNPDQFFAADGNAMAPQPGEEPQGVASAGTPTGGPPPIGGGVPNGQFPAPQVADQQLAAQIGLQL